jgi:hypothetical protein
MQTPAAAPHHRGARVLATLQQRSPVQESRRGGMRYMWFAAKPTRDHPLRCATAVPCRVRGAGTRRGGVPHSDAGHEEGAVRGALLCVLLGLARGGRVLPHVDVHRHRRRGEGQDRHSRVGALSNSRHQESSRDCCSVRCPRPINACRTTSLSTMCEVHRSRSLNERPKLSECDDGWRSCRPHGGRQFPVRHLR